MPEQIIGQGQCMPNLCRYTVTTSVTFNHQTDVTTTQMCRQKQLIQILCASSGCHDHVPGIAHRVQTNNAIGLVIPAILLICST